MMECSKWRRLLVGMVPSGAMGWRPTKSSIDMKTVVTKIMEMGSKYLNLGTGNHGRER